MNTKKTKKKKIYLLENKLMNAPNKTVSQVLKIDKQEQ